MRADLLDVFRIEKRSFPQPWPFSAFERYLGRPGFLVAEDESAGLGLDGETDGDGEAVGRVAGFVVADTIPNHNRPLGHIKDIAVHPERRGQGIGRTLLERALAVLSAQGARSVKLEVRRSNEAAISLYREFGFEYLRTLPRYYGDGEDAFVFITRLSTRDRE
nr:GNAT family N-acetyltransferase [Halospeciosus flavus]